MKRVIDIPENDFVIYCRAVDEGMANEAVRRIVKGTLLPKGHGRLIDADALYDSTKLCHTEEDGTACVEWREINDAPTIIEADKGVSE